MIFVTTGTQAPFNRLVKAIDSIAKSLNHEVVVQASGVDFDVQNIKVVDFLAPKDFEVLFNDAEIIISHAGMGSIISALTIAKPIIVVPRRAALGEHRNDHQMATAKRMEALGYVPVVYELENELLAAVQALLGTSVGSTVKKVGNFASKELVDSLEQYILRK